MMFQYSLDNDGKYPHGQSSTEVFQQLIDQSYVADPSVFYFPMPGKTKPTSNKLKPENVCSDVTDGAQSGDPDNLPVVFTTGYKINYETDFGHATLAYPLTKPALPGIVVGFMNNSSSFVPATADGVLLINSTFDSKGKTYRQLTPNGPLH